MPRTDGRKLKAAVVARPANGRALTASGRKVSKIPNEYERLSKASKVDSNWQTLTWGYLDTIGEYRYAVNWVGNLLSQAVLKVQKDGEDTDEEKVVEFLAALFGGDHPEMLRQLGIHLTVAGDTYILGTDPGEGEDEEWLVGAATDTSKVDESHWKVGEESFNDPFVMRLWRPHPKSRLRGDAPSRAVLPVLKEISGLTDRTDAQINSRLAGAGILTIPNEITFGKPSLDDDTEPDPDSAEAKQLQVDRFITMLLETMAAALGDRSDPSALVPIVLQGPGEWLDKVRLVDLSSQLDEKGKELRDEAIRRLALGMDMPPEVLTGTGDMNHWNAWQVEEASIKSHTEPLLDVITASLTEGYLWSLLVDDGMDLEAAKHYRIVADTSALRLRVNRSKEAMELYDRGVLSAAAVLRENGFDELTDKMGDDEFKEWLVRRAAGGSTTPEIVEAAIAYLGAPLEVKAPADAAGTEARPTRSLEDHPTRELPDSKDAVTASAANQAEDVAADAVVWTSWAIVARALERAGNRLRTKMDRRVPGVTAAETYRYVEVRPDELPQLLTDAWGMAEQFASVVGIDPKAYAASLDQYTRDLIVNRQPVTIEGLAAHLAPQGQ